MTRDYDLFEMLPDGSPIWHEHVAGHEEALRRLQELAKRTTNEVRMMHLPTNSIIAAMNTPKT
jgi:hypothetical protein